MKLKRKKWTSARNKGGIGGTEIATLPENAVIHKISEQGTSPVYVYYSVPEEDSE